MRITKVAIENFQSHEHLEIKPSQIFVVVGDGDLGKSAILRAIRWCLFNVPEGDSFRRHYYKDGEKILTNQTSVSVEFDNGVVITRVKSNTINKYIIHQPGKDEIVLNRFGRGLPQEVVDATGINLVDIAGNTCIVHYHNQHDPPFLLSMNGPTRWKAISILAGTEIADKTTQSFNADILQSGKDISRIGAEVSIYQKSLEEASKRTMFLAGISEKLHRIQQTIGDKQERISKLRLLIQQIEQARIRWATLTKGIKAATSFVENCSDILETMIERQDRWSNAKRTFEKYNSVLKSTNDCSDSLDRSSFVSRLDAERYVKLSQRFSRVSTLRRELLDNGGARAGIARRIESIEPVLQIQGLEQNIASSKKMRIINELSSRYDILRRKYVSIKRVENAIDPILNLNIGNLPVERLASVGRLYESVNSWKERRTALLSNLKAAQAKAEEKITEETQILVQAKVCPICGQTTDHTFCS